MTKESPDPSDFTGNPDRKEQGAETEKDQKNQSEGVLAKIKDPVYSTLGVKDSETGEIDKRRRNLIGLGAGVLGGGTYATYTMMEDEFPTSNNVLNGDECETVYSVDSEVAQNQNFVETREQFLPNEEERYIVAPDSDGDWYLSGLTPEEEGAEYEWDSIPLEDDKLSVLLDNTGEDKAYDWGEDVIEYCLEPGAWPK